jgi:hypothetical protein
MKKKTVKYVTFDDEDKYEAGRTMLSNAIFIAYNHGMWDNDEARRIFGENGWLRKWEDMPDLPKMADKKKKVKKDVTP